MTFLDLLRARPNAPTVKLDCPFCPGSSAQGGALCSVCRNEALHLGRMRA